MGCGNVRIAPHGGARIGGIGGVGHPVPPTGPCSTAPGNKRHTFGRQITSPGQDRRWSQRRCIFCRRPTRSRRFWTTQISAQGQRQQCSRRGWPTGHQGCLTGSDSVNLGSNPSSPASLIPGRYLVFRISWLRKPEKMRNGVRTSDAHKSAQSFAIPHRHLFRTSHIQMIGELTAAEERSLHTGEVVGSIPTAPTICIKDLAQMACKRAHVSPKKSLETDPRERTESSV